MTPGDQFDPGAYGEVRRDRAAANDKTAVWAIGALLFPLEVLATMVVEDGPSTELMVARRRQT